MIPVGDLIGAALTWLVLSVGAVWWSRRRSEDGPEWGAVDAFAALLVMIWSGSLGGLVFVRAMTDTWTPEGAVPLMPALLGTAAAGLITVAFMRARTDFAGLGVVRSAPRWMVRGAVWVIAFQAVSISWGILLQALDIAPEQELGLAVMEQWPSVESGLMIGYGVLVAPLVEELLFRGFLLPPLARRLGRAGGIALSALLFGLLHMTDPQAVPPLVVLGAVLGWLRLASGSLLPALILHAGNNTLAFSLLLLSLQVEGG